MQYCRNAGFEPEVAFESEQAENPISGRVESGNHAAAGDGARAPVGQRIAMVRIQSLTPRRTVVATGRPGRYLSTNARQFFWCAETVAASWQRSSNDG